MRLDRVSIMIDDGQILDESKMRENLRAARIASGLSQATLADILGITPQAYQRLEKGKTRLLNEHYQQCAKVFGISLAELINGFKPVRNAEAVLTDMRESYGRKFKELESGHRTEIRVKEQEMERMSDSIKEKDEFIATQKLLIDQLMRMKKD